MKLQAPLRFTLILFAVSFATSLHAASVKDLKMNPDEKQFPRDRAG